MNIPRLYKLKAATERASSVQREWERQKRKLLALPARLGFNSVRELQLALSLVTPKVQTRFPAPISARKKRVVITTALQNRTKALFLSGKTNREIAGILNLSPASIQNIKARLRLTRKRD